MATIQSALYKDIYIYITVMIFFFHHSTIMSINANSIMLVGILFKACISAPLVLITATVYT